jgi:hypothetical protein
MANFLCTSLDVAERFSERGMTLRLDDNPTAITAVLRYATNYVLRKLMVLYDQAAIVQDAIYGGVDGMGGETRELAIDVACYRLALRRGNTAPASFKEAFRMADETLEQLRTNMEQLPNVAQSAPSYIAYSNLTIQDYIYKRIRVESQISDTPPKGYVQTVDWFGAYYIEW